MAWSPQGCRVQRSGGAWGATVVSGDAGVMVSAGRRAAANGGMSGRGGSGAGSVSAVWRVCRLSRCAPPVGVSGRVGESPGAPVRAAGVEGLVGSPPVGVSGRIGVSPGAPVRAAAGAPVSLGGCGPLAVPVLLGGVEPDELGGVPGAAGPLPGVTAAPGAPVAGRQVQAGRLQSQGWKFIKAEK